MKITCPVCQYDNLIADEDISASSFSFLCEKCSQLLSVKVLVEAMSLVKSAAKEEEPVAKPKNRVADYIKTHMDKIHLPVLPVLASKMHEARKHTNVSINDIAEMVKTDQIIASKILELANSALYGGLVEITDLKRAIIKLGLNTTEMLVQALENKRIYSTEDRHVKPILEKLWLHALGVATTAQEIAKEREMPEASEIFTAGLLHDFGYVLFLQALIQAEGFKVDLAALTIEEFMEVAYEDHARLGAHFLSHRGLPKQLTNIVACHEETPEEEVGNLSLHVVTLANLLCKKVGIALVPEPDLRLELAESAQVLGFSELKLADLEVRCEDLIHKLIDICS